VKPKKHIVGQFEFPFVEAKKPKRKRRVSAEEPEAVEPKPTYTNLLPLEVVAKVLAVFCVGFHIMSDQEIADQDRAASANQN